MRYLFLKQIGLIIFNECSLETCYGHIVLPLKIDITGNIVYGSVLALNPINSDL